MFYLLRLGNFDHAVVAHRDLEVGDTGVAAVCSGDVLLKSGCLRSFRVVVIPTWSHSQPQHVYKT